MYGANAVISTFVFLSSFRVLYLSMNRLLLLVMCSFDTLSRDRLLVNHSRIRSDVVMYGTCVHLNYSQSSDFIAVNTYASACPKNAYCMSLIKHVCLPRVVSVFIASPPFRMSMHTNGCPIRQECISCEHLGIYGRIVHIEVWLAQVNTEVAVQHQPECARITAGNIKTAYKPLMKPDCAIICYLAETKLVDF